ncbi:MAG: response regulator transcription factor [Chitinophagaceae bacterium]|nr:response regulator transcription factor [Chitinophagaceae bacterium]
MLSKSINVALVDHHSLFRKTLSDFLSRQQQISVSFEAPNLDIFLEHIDHLLIDLLVCDLYIPNTDIAASLKIIKKKKPNLRILILYASTDIDKVEDLLKIGIHGFVSKVDDAERLIYAIEIVSSNNIYQTQFFTEALYKEREKLLNDETEQIKLNERDIKVLELLWDEKSNKEIADEIFLSVRSVEKIRQDIKDRIGAKSTIGIFKYALSKRILTI